MSETSEALMSSAQSKLETGDLQGALSDLKMVLEKDSEFTPAMIELANLQLRLGDMENAQKYLRKAVDVDYDKYKKEFDRFNDINLKMSDGGRQIKSGQFEEAFLSYEVVVKEFPHFTEAVYSMGLAKFRLKDFESCVMYFRSSPTGSLSFGTRGLSKYFPKICLILIRIVKLTDKAGAET